MFLTKPVLDVLDRCHWVHALGMSKECEGCANDGEPGYCLGAGIGAMQDSDDELYCHCGHVVVMVETPMECGCSGPDGWHCGGEDSQHWAAGDDPDAECGHCGLRPSDVAVPL